MKKEKKGNYNFTNHLSLELSGVVENGLIESVRLGAVSEICSTPLDFFPTNVTFENDELVLRFKPKLVLKEGNEPVKFKNHE